MPDGRRTRWVAHDVYFLDDDLGATMFDRFGAAGLALWLGFIAACKKNHNEGETTFSSDAEALVIFGLPGMPLVDSDGVPFSLADWLQLLSDHKVIRRTSRGRRTKVACSKWGAWQKAARSKRKADAEAERRDQEAQQNRRSEPDYTDTVSARNGHDVSPKQAQMTDTDTDTDSKPLGPADAAPKKPKSRDLLFEALCRESGIDWTAKLTKSERGEVNHAVRQLREIDATPDQVAAKCRAYRRKWPRVDLTPSAIVKHWSKVDGVPAPAKKRSGATDGALTLDHDPGDAEARYRALTEGATR